MKLVWDKSVEQMKRAIALHAKYYDSHHKSVNFEVRQLALLSAVYLSMKGAFSKWIRKYVGPFRIIKNIGTQSYRLEWPSDWKVHNAFQISLLKFWKQSEFMQVSIQTWRHRVGSTTRRSVWDQKNFASEEEKSKKKIREFLLLWAGYQLEEATWELEDHFTNKQQLHWHLEAGNILEEKDDSGTESSRGSSCGVLEPRLGHFYHIEFCIEF